ncbi:MAG: ABC transporter permease [Actinomycetota bacterium]|nr:ABC transporter permease [Actinomycetota bacterium]
MAAGASAVRSRGLPGWLRGAGEQVLPFLAALAFAGLIGAIIIVTYGENPMDVYRAIWSFSTGRPSDVARVLVNATPLVFSALAVAVAFKAGMFNIGVEGQYLVGMVTASAAALGLGDLPAPLLLPAVVLAAMAGAMAWAAVPAILKVRTGAHEVVTTIMMNGIAVSLVGWALLNPLRTAERGLVDLRTDRFAEAARMPDLPSSLGLSEVIPRSVHLTWLLPLAVVACMAVWYLIYRTRLGYGVRAVGSSAGSAEAGGISIGATQLKVFLVSGALAGLVGLNHLIGDRGFLGQNYESGLGFAGIAVAFLGRNHPVGVFLAAVLFGMLGRGEEAVQITSNVPREIIIILQGVLILSVVVAYELTRRSIVRRRQREVRAAEPDAAGEAVA